MIRPGSRMSDDKSLGWTNGSPVRYVLWYIFGRANPQPERAGWRRAWLAWCAFLVALAFLWRFTGNPLPLLLALLVAALPIPMRWLAHQWHDPEMERTFEAETARLMETGNCFKCGRPRGGGEEKLCRSCRTGTYRVGEIGVVAIVLLALAWLATRSLQ